MRRDAMKRIHVFVAIGVFMASAISAHANKETWQQEFARVSDEYFDQVYFPYGPTGGNAGRLSPV